MRGAAPLLALLLQLLLAPAAAQLGVAADRLTRLSVNQLRDVQASDGSMVATPCHYSARPCGSGCTSALGYCQDGKCLDRYFQPEQCSSITVQWCVFCAQRAVCFHACDGVRRRYTRHNRSPSLSLSLSLSLALAHAQNTLQQTNTQTTPKQ